MLHARRWTAANLSTAQVALAARCAVMQASRRSRVCQRCQLSEQQQLLQRKCWRFALSADQVLPGSPEEADWRPWACASVVSIASSNVAGCTSLQDPLLCDPNVIDPIVTRTSQTPTPNPVPKGAFGR